jgi:hypothetical protein
VIGIEKGPKSYQQVIIGVDERRKKKNKSKLFIALTNLCLSQLTYHF